MAKVLQDIWILTEGGITVYHRVFNDKLDDQLFGGLMSALNSFAEELERGGLSNFELQDKRFTILKHKSFLFIANSSIKVKVKKVMNELNSIVNRFFELFPEHILDNWDGDISMFSSFEQNIQDSLEMTLQKLKDAFW